MIRSTLLVPVLALVVLAGLAPSAPTQDRRLRPWRSPPPVEYGPQVVYPPGTVLPGSSVAPPTESSEPSVYDEIRRRAELRDLKEFSLFRAATPPIKLARVVPEWEPARFLILAMPDRLFQKTAETRSFIAVIRHALAVTDVLVLIKDYSASLRWFVRMLEDEDLADRLAPAFDGDRPDRPKMIHAVPLRVDSIWVRDYGPIFATTPDGKLCVLDSMYRDLRKEQQDREMAVRSRPDSEDGPARAPDSGDRPDDDRLPTVLATALNSRMLREQVAVVRTPLQLSGGDFFTDGAGTGFTSTNTLMMNGGDEVWVNRLFREYFGLSRMVYLEPLPGLTIKHLDMFFRPVDPTTFLLADYPSDVATSGPFFHLLHREARATLERNAAILKDKLPAAKVVRVPMPALAFSADQKAMIESSRYFLSRAGDSLGSLTGAQLIDRALKQASAGRPAASQADLMMQQVKKWREDTGITVTDEFDILSDIKDVLERMERAKKPKGTPTRQEIEAMAKLESEFLALAIKLQRIRSENHAFYRTYLNSLHLKGANKEIVIVPSYAAHRSMEVTVREQFRKAYPNADVVFVPSDVLVTQFGAIHCVTCVIPDLRSPAKP